MTAQCVCSEANVCAHSNCVCSVSFFFVCVYIKRCMDMHRGKISCAFASVFGTQAWVTAWRRLLNRGYEWARHLLSLVSQMEKGCTIQSEQSRVTNEGDISAERQTERLIDTRRTHRQRQGSGRRAETQISRESKSE